MIAQEYYHIVPKQFDANIEFRARVIEMTAGNEEMQREQNIMCSRDILYWINTYVMTFDPRRIPAAIPMITYGFQDESIRNLVEAITGGGLGVRGQHDVLIEKSRDMGASWVLLLTFMHMWLYKPNVSFLMGSRKEEYVDKAGDPKSLFWKLDFVLKYLPGWMIPGMSRTHLKFENKENGSTINGESTNADFARGDRRTAVGLDEFASVENGQQVLAATADVTNCRLFNSTPKGVGNAFYETRQNEATSIIRMHWTRHPEKAAGLYHAVDGSLEVLDPAYEFPADYPFILDGKRRSPWYDNECRRRGSDLQIAQELDIDYLGSGAMFFDAQSVEAHASKYAADPMFRGELDVDLETGDPVGFVNRKGGKLSMWVQLDDRSRLVDDVAEYVMAADISNGTGASNSALSVADRLTGEKVAEYASPHVKPEHFATLAVAMAKYFNNAELAWEANGPGRIFGDRVMELGYAKIYFRRNDESIKRRVSDKPGWFSSKESKTSLLGGYRRAIDDGSFVNRSSMALTEAKEYVYGPDGTPVHAGAISSEDPSGAKDNHGDRVIADALCNYLCKMHTRRIQDIEPEVPENSMMARRLEVQRAAREEAEW